MLNASPDKPTRRRPTSSPWVREELRRRLQAPQRHRLLQGYPMMPLMRHADTRQVPVSCRPLIVGVLPHPFCNPRLRGCGFCTFPHETFSRSAATLVVDAVMAEVSATLRRNPHLGDRRVTGLYFGGGTANLTPPRAFERLTETLQEAFDVSEAEVTVEGVPRYFIANGERMLDRLADMSGRHKRVSMGVQSFDPTWIACMGRQAFGDEAIVARAMASARRRGMTTSVDLLFNLPGQTLAAMRADLRTAIALGADQICLYNLVLFEGLGSAWAGQAEMLARRIDNRRGCNNWLALRASLLDGGYVQTTLTNFERRDVHRSPRRFVYEQASFTPERHDGIGFGPAAITTMASPAGLGAGAHKSINASRSDRYLQLVHGGGDATVLGFDYAPRDRELLAITRKLPRMAIYRRAHPLAFAGLDRRGAELRALARAGLVRRRCDVVRLTPKGMFYADAVAGLLGARRVQAIRNEAAGVRSLMPLPVVDEAAPYAMG